MVSLAPAQSSPEEIEGRRKPAPPALSPRSYVLIGASLFLLTAMLLLAMGRAPVCECRTFSIWNGDVAGPENSQHLTDWYSALHVLNGLLFFAVMWRTSWHWPKGWLPLVAIVAAAGWELVENTPFMIARFGQGVTGALYVGDSVPNALADMAFMLAGFSLAMYLPGVWSIALGVAIEIVVAVAIRDNLLIGTVMLLHPFDAIATWQVLK